MCQAIPRLVLTVAADRARVVVDGEPTWVDSHAIRDLHVGEYVVVYAGAALEKMSEEDARELLSFYNDLESLLAESDARHAAGAAT